MKDLTKGKPSTLILAFALPIFFANLLQLTYSLVDTRIVGTFLGEDALAAVGATSTLSNLIIGFLQGLSGGFAIITAQKFGAKDYKDVKKSFAMSLLIGTGIALFFTIFGLLFLQPILKMLNVPANLLETAKSYIFIIIAGLVVTYLYDASFTGRQRDTTCDPGNIGYLKYYRRFILCCNIKKWCKRCGNRNGTCTVDCIYCLLDLYGKEI